MEPRVANNAAARSPASGTVKRRTALAEAPSASRRDPAMAGGRAGAPPAQRCLYAVLGVAESASRAAIRVAFRRKARELHPDAGGCPEKFAAAAHAHAVLTDARARALYDAGRRDAADAGAEATAWAAWRAAAPSAADALVARNGLRAELRSALAVAYAGPRLDAEERRDDRDGVRVPHDFEAECRSSPDATDEVLHVVYGRTLLGVVRAVRVERIKGAGVSIGITGPSVDEQPGGETGAGQPLDAEAGLRLELEVDGRTVAHATRGSPASEVRVHHCDGAVTAVGPLGGRFTMADARCGRTGRLRHRLRVSTTLGVTHLYAYAPDGKCQARCARAWLPPSELWLFGARSELHDVGGWSFELWPSERARGEPPPECGGIPPAVLLLTCAFRTLDDEAGRFTNAPAAPGGFWPRVVGALRG